MNVANDIIISQQGLGASFNGEAIAVGQIYGFSVHMIYTGTPAGTLKIQCSNDTTTQSASVTNWVDIAGASVVISGAGSTLFNVDQVFYKWIRVVYVRSGGAGSLDVNYFAKGV